MKREGGWAERGAVGSECQGSFGLWPHRSDPIQTIFPPLGKADVLLPGWRGSMEPSSVPIGVITPRP